MCRIPRQGRQALALPMLSLRAYPTKGERRVMLGVDLCRCGDQAVAGIALALQGQGLRIQLGLTENSPQL